MSLKYYNILPIYHTNTNVYTHKPYPSLLSKAIVFPLPNPNPNLNSPTQPHNTHTHTHTHLILCYLCPCKCLSPVMGSGQILVPVHPVTQPADFNDTLLHGTSCHDKFGPLEIGPGPFYVKCGPPESPKKREIRVTFCPAKETRCAATQALGSNRHKLRVSSCN